MATISQNYLALIKAFPLRPIKSERELGEAKKVLHELLDRSSLTVSERDYLEVLGALIEEYEEAAHPVRSLAPSEMLNEAMRAKGVTRAAVAAATRIPVATVSALLSDKRDFNVEHISKLCAYFGLGPEAFISRTS